MKKPLEKSRALCSDELWTNRRPSPHDKKLEHIAEGYWASKEAAFIPSGSMWAAWADLKKAAWSRVRALPCRWLFHIPYQKQHPYSGTTYCTRCGAWRGSW